MHYLRTRVEQIEGLNGFIDSVCKNRITQAVVLDVNPIWLAAYQLSQAGIDPHILGRYWPPDLPYGHSPLDWLQSVAGSIGYMDLNWNHEVVSYLTRRVFGRDLKAYEQFLVKAVAFPTLSPELARERAALIEIVHAAPFPAIVETRTPAALVVSCGDQCISGTGNRGTIGGFLKDSLSGTIFAATCGHVVSSGLVTVKSASIGLCSKSHAPSAVGATHLCHPKGAGLTRLDLALIDIGSASVTNTLSTIAPFVYSGEDVTAIGAVTGMVSYQVGGVSLVHKIGTHCFANLFEIRPPAGSGVISLRAKALVATVPQPGDSGAWIQPTGSKEWCGMVVAADHLMGYALEADTIISEGNSVFKMNLDLA